MEKKLLILMENVADGNVTPIQAQAELLGLFSVSHSTIEKPPIGLKPKWLHDEQRHREVKEAIERYVNAHIKVPQEWLDEYNSYCC